MKKSTWIALIVTTMILLANVSALRAQEREEQDWWEKISQPRATEWWERPLLITYPERLVGACYPWLVTEHFLINLATNETLIGVGGDFAQSVEFCGDAYFVVRAAFGAYVFSKSGLMVDSVYLGSALRFVGASDNTIAVYDVQSSAVYVKLVNSKSTAVVHVHQPVLTITYSFLQYVPVIAYSVLSGNETSYFIANPGTLASIPVAGTGAITMRGNRVYVERNGVLVLEITNPVTLSYRELFYIPLPIRVTRFISVIGDYLLASSDNVLVLINVNEKSRDFRKINVIGDAVPTPIGYFVLASLTTYVITEKGIYPVPGYAVAKLDNIVFTNIVRRDEGVIIPVMWSVTSTVFVTITPFDGMLYDGEYAVKLTLAPGAYRLPRNAVVSDGVRNIVLSEPEVVYPPATVAQEPVAVSNIKFHVSNFPSQYLPIDVFHNVVFVASGAGRLVIVQPDKATVYAGYGVSTSIPGVWVYGGAGDCIVLYDGASFRLYDYSGEPIASYSYYLVRDPDYVTCRRVSASDYAVELYLNGFSEKITILGTMAKVEQNQERRVSDPRGVTAHYTATPRIEYSGVIIPVPANAKDLRISGLWATWMTASINVLSVLDSSVFVLLNPPANTTAYPINNELLAVYFYEEKRLDILPYKAWYVQNCYVDVDTMPDADVFLNGKHIATGSVRVYMPCYTRATIEARLVHHRPKKAEVYVTGPMKLTLLPEPMIANVVLNVIAPRGLKISSVVMRIDGVETLWNVSEAKSLLAKPTTLEVVSYIPIDACAKDVYNVTLMEGMNTLNVQCRLVAPVLALTSSIPATVELYAVGAMFPSQVVYVEPGVTSYMITPVGDIRLVSKPAIKGYVTKELNVSVTDVRVYELDITPYPMSKIIVRSTVPVATITVYNETGGVVATGVGSLEVEVVPGKYTVFAQAQGYMSFSMPVDVPPGEAVTIDAILKEVVVEVPPEKPMWERVEFQALSILAVVAVAVVVLWQRRKKAKEVTEELVKGEESA